MNDIETYKTITISKEIPSTVTSFTKDINIEFIPDEIVLKYVCRYHGTSTNFSK